MLLFPWSEQCSPNFGIVQGAAGRPCAPKAFVLHNLLVPLDYFTAVTQNRIRMVDRMRYPSSVHWTIGADGEAVNYVSTDDVAWGIFSYNGATPAALATNCSPHINGGLIHIAVAQASYTTEARKTLINLIYDLAAKYGITVSPSTVLPAEAFDNTLNPFCTTPCETCATCVEITELLAEYATAGPFTPPSMLPPPDPTQAAQIAALELCCTQNTAAIGTLTTSIATLQTTIAGLLARIVTLEGQIAALQAGQISPQTLQSIYALIVELKDKQILYANCLATICNIPCEPLPCKDIHYRLPPSQSYPGVTRFLPVNVSSPLAAPVKVADSVPAQVFGVQPLVLDLKCCVSTMTAAVKLKIRKFCAGSKVWLEARSTTGTVKIAEWIAPSDGQHSVTISGSYIESVIPNQVSFYIGHDESLIGVTEVETVDIQSKCL